MNLSQHEVIQANLSVAFREGSASKRDENRGGALRELSLSQGLEWTPFRGTIYTLWPASCGRRKTHPPGVGEQGLLEDFGERFWNNLMVTSRSRKHWCCFGGTQAELATIKRCEYPQGRDPTCCREGTGRLWGKVSFPQ